MWRQRSSSSSGLTTRCSRQQSGSTAQPGSPNSKGSTSTALSSPGDCTPRPVKPAGSPRDFLSWLITWSTEPEESLRSHCGLYQWLKLGKFISKCLMLETSFTQHSSLFRTATFIFSWGFISLYWIIGWTNLQIVSRYYFIWIAFAHSFQYISSFIRFNHTIPCSPVNAYAFLSFLVRRPLLRNAASMPSFWRTHSLWMVIRHWAFRRASMGSSWAACWRTHDWWPRVWWQEKDSILNTHRGSYTQSSPRSMATASCKRMNATCCRYVLLLYIILIYILDLWNVFLRD